MPNLINEINGTIIEFNFGSFDAWCVYITKSSEVRYAPSDPEIFDKFKYFGKKHGYLNIYNDFVEIYTLTDRFINPKIIKLISKLSLKYKEDEEDVKIWYTVIYAAMIAEENKRNMILKKRIKRLGVHQLLIEGLTPTYCGSYSKGKKWRELDKIMVSKGF